MDEKDLSILYRPQVEIERDYRSDGVILHELPDNATPEEKQQSAVPEIPDEITKAIQNSYEAGSTLLRIRKITEILPAHMKPTVDDLLDTVMIWIGITIEKLKEVKENEPPDDERHEVPGGPQYGPQSVGTPESLQTRPATITTTDEQTTTQEDYYRYIFL